MTFVKQLGEAAMDEDQIYEGGCLCGAVRYTLHAPAKEVWHCHCEMCRKAWGALFSTTALVGRDDITNNQGQDNLTTYKSSPAIARHFCRTCGCDLFADLVDELECRLFAPATLDGGVHPGHPEDKESHIYVGSKAGWETISDGLPQFETE